MADRRSATNWIGGEWTAGGVEQPSINPADGRIFGSYADNGAEAAGNAIAAAAKALAPDTWRCDPMLRTTALRPHGGCLCRTAG